MATMNKNRKKIMAVLALTLALACVAGGVLAKYVTSSTGGDSARVAYWGFDQSATIDIQMFDGTYDNVASGSLLRCTVSQHITPAIPFMAKTYSKTLVMMIENGTEIMIQPDEVPDPLA